MALRRRVEVVVPTLSDDVLLHLLSWLPLRQIARTRRVCKRWRTLINSRPIPGPPPVLLTENIKVRLELPFLLRQRPREITIVTRDFVRTPICQRIVRALTTLAPTLTTFHVHVRYGSSTEVLLACAPVMSERATNLLITGTSCANLAEVMAFPWPHLKHLGLLCNSLNRATTMAFAWDGFGWVSRIESLAMDFSVDNISHITAYFLEQCTSLKQLEVRGPWTVMGDWTAISRALTIERLVVRGSNPVHDAWFHFLTPLKRLREILLIDTRDATSKRMTGDYKHLLDLFASLKRIDFRTSPGFVFRPYDFQ